MLRSLRSPGPHREGWGQAFTGRQAHWQGVVVAVGPQPTAEPLSGGEGKLELDEDLGGLPALSLQGSGGAFR